MVTVVELAVLSFCIMGPVHFPTQTFFCLFSFFWDFYSLKQHESYSCNASVDLQLNVVLCGLYYFDSLYI